jgi:hypothetical protein
MSDAPERIFASPDTSCASNEWKSAMWHGHQHMQRPDWRTEYIRADLHRAEVEALQAQLAERDRALAEWADVSQRNFQRAKAAEDRLAESRAGLVRYRYVLHGVRHAIKTGQNEPLMIWADQVDIALSDTTLAKIGGAE